MTVVNTTVHSVFYVIRMNKSWFLSYSQSDQRRLRSACAEAQADLSLRRAHMTWVTYSHVETHLPCKNNIPVIIHASLLFCNHLPANYCIQYYVQVQMYGGRYKNHNDIYIVFVCHDKKHDQKNKVPITYANNQVLPACASVQSV